MGDPCFAIIVSFRLAPGAEEQFLQVVKENAATSVRDEPGCLRFDVIGPGTEGEIPLYEIYRDRAAFEAHLATPHFKAFDAASRDLAIEKIARGGDLAEHVKAF
jgi:quinol monooxygenase YgiN